MSALVVDEEIERFNEGERVLTRLYCFLACFIWPLTAIVLWLAVLMGASILGLDPLPGWLKYLLIGGALAALAQLARVQLRTLRAADAALDAFYATAVAEVPPVGSPQQQAALPAAAEFELEAEPTPLLLRLARGARAIVLAAPQLSAKAGFSWKRAITWDEAACTAAKTAFDALGATGGAWVACSAHPGSAALLAGLERLKLVEHRRQAVGEVRLRPDIRRRYFPKDPHQAMYQPPPRRR